MSLGMVTCQALRKRFTALIEVSAVAASPNRRPISFEYPTGIDTGRQFQIPFFMLLFSNCNGLEDNCICHFSIFIPSSGHQPFLM
jgi:hypothetical protein